jgi:Zn-dependent alcohol dehydrogenase
MRTRAAIIREPGKPWEITELEPDEPRAGEIRIRFAASGMCHSDEHPQTGDSTGRLPMVGGHEEAGVIEAAGPDVTRVKIGDHVVCSFIPRAGPAGTAPPATRTCATGARRR